jgi:hypothetical protein
MKDVDDAQVAIADQLAAVGPEVDGDAVGKAAASGHANAEPLAHGAVRAVGGDRVLRLHGPLDACLSRAHDGGDVIVGSVERDHLRRVLEPRAELRGTLLDHRLEPDLRDEEPRRRAEVLDTLVDVAEVPVELLAAEGLDRDDRAVLLELFLRGRKHVVLDPRGAERLDRPLQEHRGTRVDRRSRMTLHDEVLDAEAREEQRQRQPDEAAADDQNRDLLVGFDRARPDRARVPGAKILGDDDVSLADALSVLPSGGVAMVAVCWQ